MSGLKNALLLMLKKNIKIFDMVNNIMYYLSLFLAPLFTALLPLQFSLICLLILISANYISAVVCTFNLLRLKAVDFVFFRALFNDGNMKRFFKKCYEYIFAVLVVGLFEVYILELDNPTEGISMLRLTVISAGVVEVNQMFMNIECVTGGNILHRIKDLIPDRLKTLLYK